MQSKGAIMKMKIFLIAVVAALAIVSCATGEKEALDQKTIETVAKISAMVEIDELQALKMLETEEMSLDKYKEIINAITLDAKATEKFLQMKKAFLQQYQK